MDERGKSQLDKFKVAARELEPDDLECFKEKLAKIAKHKPVGRGWTSATCRRTTASHDFPARR